MTSLLRRKRRTTVRGRSTPARRAASLAVLGVLLWGGLASAQTMGRPIPVTGAVVPAVHTADPGELQPIQQVSTTAPTASTGVQPAAYQPRPASPPTASDDVDIDFDQELPDITRVYRLESERNWQERLTQHEKDKGKPKPIFPEYAVLTSDKYYGRQWPQQNVRPEANYVVYDRLYFEQKNFERYGWDLGPISPIVESLVFGLDTALLPYNMGTDPFRNYETSAGYCMPGDPTPLLLWPLPLSLTGFVAEGAAIGTLVPVFP
jgi:hypothetical protein